MCLLAANQLFLPLPGLQASGPPSFAMQYFFHSLDDDSTVGVFFYHLFLLQKFVFFFLSFDNRQLSKFSSYFLAPATFTLLPELCHWNPGLLLPSKTLRWLSVKLVLCSGCPV